MESSLWMMIATQRMKSTSSRAHLVEFRTGSTKMDAASSVSLRSRHSPPAKQYLSSLHLLISDFLD